MPCRCHECQASFLSSIFLCTVQGSIKGNSLAPVLGLPSSHHWARMHKPSKRFSLEAKWLRREQYYVTQKKDNTNDCLVLKSGTNKPTTLSLQPFRFYCLLCSPPQPQSVKRGVWESLKSSQVKQEFIQQTLTEHTRGYCLWVEVLRR